GSGRDRAACPAVWRARGCTRCRCRSPPCGSCSGSSPQAATTVPACSPYTCPCPPCSSSSAWATSCRRARAGRRGSRRGAAAKRFGTSWRGFVAHAVAVGAFPAARPALAAGELPDHEPDHEREKDPAGEITIPDEPAHEAEHGEQPEEGNVPGHEPLHGLHASPTLPCPRLSPTSCSLPSEPRVAFARGKILPPRLRRTVHTRARLLRRPT